jgi:hypothetical protein
MKKLLALFAILFSFALPAFAGPEWQPFFTCDPGTGGTCSYTLSISVVMPTGSYTTNTLNVRDGNEFHIGNSGFRYSKSTTVTLKDGSGNSMCSSPFTGTNMNPTINSTNVTMYAYTITCGATGLTGGNTYTLTISGTSTDTSGSSSTAGPVVWVYWVLG